MVARAVLLLVAGAVLVAGEVLMAGAKQTSTKRFAGVLYAVTDMHTAHSTLDHLGQFNGQP